MKNAQTNPQKPFEVQRSERGLTMKWTIVVAESSERLAVVTMRKARITEEGAVRAQIRLKADAVVPNHWRAVEVIGNALSMAHRRAKESEKRPEGMVAPCENMEYVRFLTDGVDECPGVAGYEGTLIPAGYYGHLWHNSAQWDWERGVVVYGIGTIVPGAFHRSRYATADEFEVYEGDPWKDDLKRTKAHQPLIDLDGNKIEVTA